MSEERRASPRRAVQAVRLGWRGVGWLVRRMASLLSPVAGVVVRRLPGMGHRAIEMTPPIPVITRSYHDLGVEVTIVGVDGKGPVFSVMARIAALGAASPARSVTAEAVQMAFQDQFAARGETVTDASAIAIVPSLDDARAWYVLARVTRLRGRRN